MTKTQTSGTVNGSKRAARDLVHVEDLSALAALLRKAVGSAKDGAHRKSLRYADSVGAKR